MRGWRFRPDCADLVYFLRAYFAFKMGLAVRLLDCSRGKPPKALRVQQLNPRSGRPGPNRVVRRVFGVVADAVSPVLWPYWQTTDKNRLYTVPLKQETLRPGTVYADPYGHVMMLVRRVPESGGAAGVFLGRRASLTGQWAQALLARQFPVCA